LNLPESAAFRALQLTGPWPLSGHLLQTCSNRLQPFPIDLSPHLTHRTRIFGGDHRHQLVNGGSTARVVATANVHGSMPQTTLSTALPRPPSASRISTTPSSIKPSPSRPGRGRRSKGAPRRARPGRSHARTMIGNRDGAAGQRHLCLVAAVRLTFRQLFSARDIGPKPVKDLPCPSLPTILRPQVYGPSI